MKSRVFPETFCSWEILGALAPEMHSYLGIGVQEGGCVQTIVRVNPDVDLMLCDTWGFVHGGTGRENHDHIAVMLKSLGHRGSVTFLDGRSQDLIPLQTKVVEVSYVDGDHGYDCALADFRNTWPLTSTVLVAHDMKTNPPAYDAMQTFLSETSNVKEVQFVMDCAVLWR
jgi:hypothetical protein